MMDLPNDETTEEIQGPISEGCIALLNKVASYKMHISDIYLSMVSMGS
jgi:hypothetical protein